MEDKSLYTRFTVEKPTPVIAKTITHILLISLAVVIIVNVTFSYWILLTSHAGAEFSQWHKLATYEGDAELLVIGDSTAYLGVDERLVEEQLGMQTVNFATNVNWGVSGDLWMLEAYLEEHEAPEYIVIIHTAHVYGTEISPELMASFTSRPGYRQSRDFRRENFTLPQQADILIRRQTPFYFQNEEAIAYLLNPLQHRLSSALEEADGQYNTLLDNTRKEENIARRAEEVMDQWDYDQGFNLSKESHQAMEQITRLAETYDFQVYLFTAPYLDTMENNETFQNYYSGYLDSVKLWDSMSEHVIFIDEQIYLEAEYLLDLHHTNRTGQTEYSLELSALLQSFIDNTD